MKRIYRKKISLILALFIGSIAPSFSQTWSGGCGTVSSSQVYGNSANITTACTLTVATGVTLEITGSLAMSGNSVLIIQSGATLKVDGAINFSNMNVIDDGSFKVAGSFSGNAMAITGTGTFLGSGGGVLNGGATIFGSTSFTGCSSSPGCSCSSSTPATPSITSPTILCAGTNTTLIANSGASGLYQWTKNGASISGATTSSVSNVTATAGDVYGVYIPSCGNGSSGTATITAQNAAVAPASISPTTGCKGSTQTYTAAAVSGATSYTWTVPSGGTGSSTTNTISITWSTGAPSSGNLQVTATTACGTSSQATQSITLASPPSTPTITASASTSCITGSITLKSSSATNNTWSTLATTQSITVSTAGSYTVTVSSGACTATSTPTVVTAEPTAPTGTAASRCGTGTVTLSVSGGSGTSYNWYTALTGGTGTAGNTYTTPSINNTTTYYVTSVSGTCESSPRTAVVATVNTIPSAPTGTNGSTCGAGTATLSASGSPSTYNWYSASSGGTSLATTASFLTPSISTTTTYYVTAVSAAGCESSTRTAVVANVYTAPVATFATSPTSICSGSTAAVTITANITTAYSDGVYTGYSGPSSTGPWTLIASGPSSATSINYSLPSNPTSTTYYYFVYSSASTTCDINSNVTSLTVNALPSAPTVTNGVTCATGTVTLSASGSPSTYNWYTASTGGTSQGTASTFTTPSISTTTTYYVTAVSAAGCESSPRTVVVATVSSTPATPAFINSRGTVDLCSALYTTLSVTSPSGTGTYTWYDNGTSVGTGNSYVVSSPVAGDSYTLEYTNASGCTSAASSAMVVESGTPSITVTPVATSTCTGTNVTFSINLVSGVGNATPSYEWALNGATIGGGATHSTYNFTTTSLSSGNTVEGIAISACGNSGTYTLTIPTAPTSISPVTPACNGTTVTYTENGGAGGPVLTYAWTITGGTGTSTTSSDAITWSTSGTENITVAAVASGCTSSVFSQNITVSTGVPSAAGAITGTSSICEGQSTLVTYSVAPVSNTVSYSWTIPAGATISGSSTSNSISVNYSGVTATGSQTIQVTPVNGCGDGTSSSFNVTVNTLPSAPTVTNGSNCGTGTVTLSASGSPTTYNWYAASTGGSSLATTATYSPSISTTTTYYVTAVSAAGCESTPRTAVVATINTLASAPTVTNSSRCGAGTVTLSASGSPSTYNWYAASTGGVSLATTASFLTPSISTTTTYYVTAVSVAGCESTPRTTVVATVNTVPSAPTGIPNSICGTGTVTLSASGSPSTYNWYTVSTGGTSQGTAASFTTPSISATTTYYVTAVSAAGCESTTRTAVVATINTVPSAPTGIPNSRCGTGTVTLSASGSPSTYNWYTVSTGGTSQGTAASFTTPSISTTTTYYVTAVSASGCESTTRTAVIATINTVPSAPTGIPNSRCGTGTVTLSASGSPSTYNWYLASTGGTSQGTAASFTTPSISATTTYYVTAVSAAGCESTTRTAVIATINTVPSAPTGIPGSICGTGTVTLSASGSPSTYNWYTVSTGGTSQGTAASFTTPSISATTTYYVTAVSAAGCESATRTAVIATINTVPSAPTGIPGSICGTGKVTLSASGSPSTYNWYTVSTGGTSQGTAASFTTPSISATTTYYVTAVSAAGCESSTRTAVIATVNTVPSAPTGIPNSRCGTGTVTLSASGSPSTYNWYTVSTGGTSQGTAASFTTPSISATTTYYVTAVSAAGCESSTRTAVVATINTVPSAPTGIPNSICGTGTVTLSASGSPSTYNWYTVSTGGTSQGTAASFTTPSISATTTYYVTAVSAAGCESATRTAVVATVNTVPSAPTGIPNSICGTGTVTLSASGSPSTYNWYTVSTGGTSQGTAASFTTPSISATTTYYVTAVSAAGCESTTRTAVIATVNTVPSAPTGIPNSRCGTGTVTLSASGSPSTYNWYTVSTGGTSQGTAASFTTPSISATTTYYVTAVSAAGCESSTRTSVIATINTVPSAPTGIPNSICGTGTVTLSASGSPSTYNWYLASTGGTSQGTAASFTTPSISATTTYYVTAVSAAGCESATRTAVIATINTVPSAPTGIPNSICGTGTVTLSASGSPSTYNWYNVSTGGTSQGTAASFTTPSISATTTYYVTAVSAAGCESSTRTAVIATINTVPSAPTGIPGSICGTGTVTLSASGSPSTYNWYTVSTGGTSQGTAASFTTPSISATTTYYVTAVSAAGCESTTRTSVIATINTVPSAPTGIPNSICGTGTVTLSASGSPSTYNWYLASTGGTSQGTAASFTTPSISATTTYYVTAVSAAGCESATRTSVIATINTVPSAPTGIPNSICGTGTVTLSASGSPSTYNWYTVSTGGTSQGTAASFTTPSISATTTYYVTAVSAAGCESATRTAVIATVNPNLPVSVSIAPSSNPICSGTSVTFTATPTNGGSTPSYQWQVNGSNVGTNSSTYSSSSFNNNDAVVCVLTSNATCATGSPASSATTTMTVNPNLPVSVSIVPSSNPICSGTSVTFTATPTNGGTTPSYQWQVNGSNVGTNSGTYSSSSFNNNDAVVCVLTSNATCATGSPATSSTTTMTVNPNLPVSVSIVPSSNPICSGTSVTFTATPTNGGSIPSYQWQVNGSNVGTNSTTYTSTSFNNNDAVVCVLTSNATCATGSPATSATTTMTVNPNLPVSVTITPSSNSICSGTSVTFTATPTNGGTTPSYQWQVNGSNVGTNSTTYTSASFNNNDAVTCVLTSNATCATGSPATTTMTVNPNLPVSVTIAPSSNPICNGTSVTFTATPTNGGSTPSYQWQVNGSNVGTNSTTYTSSSFNNNDAVVCVLTSNATCATGSPATSSTTTMTVNAIPTAPSSISPTATATLGSTITYTESAGTGTTYVWTITGGTTSSSTTSAAITWNTAGTEQIQVAAVANGCTSTVFTQPISVSPSEIWTGTTSTDWNTATNWSLGVVPTSQISVTIPSVTNRPVISVIEIANVAAITINSSSSLTNNGILNANSDLTNNGTLTLSNGSLLNLFGNLINTLGTITDNGATTTFEGSTAQTFSGPAAGTTLSSVTLNNSNGLTLSNKLTISSTLTLSSGAMASNSNLTVNLYTGGISGAGNGSISGNITVDKRADTIGYHYISAPLFPSTASDVGPNLNYNAYYSLYYYDETNTWPGDSIGWTPITSPSYALTPMMGYAYYFFSTPETLTYTNTYTHSASYSIGLTSTLSIPDVANQDGWNLVGNPYPSSIDWDASLGWNKTGIDDAVYFYNPAAGVYASYILGAGINGGVNVIPSMQAFWVHVSIDGATGASLGINNNARTTGAAPLLWRTGIQTNYMTVTAQGPDGKKDQTVLRFLPGATNGYDPSYDAYKMGNDAGSPNLYTTIGANQYSINTLSDSTTFTLPLNYVAGTTGNTTLTFVGATSISNYQVTLFDKKTNTLQDLKATPSYTYSATANDTTTRLYINFNYQSATPQIVTGVIGGGNNSGITINNDATNAYINFINSKSTYADIYVYNILGEAVFESKNTNISSGNYIINGDNFSTGVYIVKVVMNGETTSQKVVFSE